ncbi:putative F-box/kelch-repeat protein At3g17280 isoform X1 [Lactuca sativa]|uniref:F-box domain-containing protein n=2 Tax=Lactuca sativa TaxID=4236 RepID=A0A9R1XHL4_LACSA|nr:putative F-box/kelch-repeat protein At3g17280 isoform X1 [Lactuca sativa]XP_042757284.1 putative F-box/kelch-repeat protein At3g17280 isoform X1 [Lactuca sativa]KAJ0213306.1 hypothetical protein LSAT_V11C400207770 [Lactuca sativa]
MAESHPRKLPQEILLFQILPRMPVEALPSLMCVCKKWYLFLKSGAFASALIDDHENHHKHLVLPTTDGYTFCSIDCEAPKDGLTMGRFPFLLPINMRHMINISILTSVHGLLCLGTIKHENPDIYSDLTLWNPFTNDDKRLSKMSCDTQGIFGLYYISSDDDYRLLYVTHHPNIYIYSVKSDSWRNVESTEDFKQSASDWTEPGNYWTKPGDYWEHPSHFLLNEKLYFLKQVETEPESFIRSYSVMRFDTKTEKFTEIAMPSFGNQMTNCLGFMVLKGCVHFCVAILIEEESYMSSEYCNEMIELWKMDGDGDWTKVLTYGPISFFPWSKSLIHLMRNGNLLIHAGSNVYELDMKKNTKEIVFTCEDMDSKISPIGKYIESTVSLNNDVVSKWFFTINGLEWCSVRSWKEYEAYERSMIEKYGEDIIQHTGDNVELWKQSQVGKRKSHVFGIGYSDLKFVATGRPSYGCAMSSFDYTQLQQQVQELQIQIEMERKAREKLQAQILELTRRFNNHPGNPPNPS